MCHVPFSKFHEIVPTKCDLPSLLRFTTLLCFRLFLHILRFTSRHNIYIHNRYTSFSKNQNGEKDEKNALQHTLKKKKKIPSMANVT